MKKLNETGKLSVGIEFAGKVHRDFVLRPLLVRDPIEILEEDERAARNDHYFNICLLARQIVKLGDIPKENITPDLVMSLLDIDFETLSNTKGAQVERLKSFRDEEEA